MLQMAVNVASAAAATGDARNLVNLMNLVWGMVEISSLVRRSCRRVGSTQFQQRWMRLA